jgi:multiple sugar transport system permease protein
MNTLRAFFRKNLPHYLMVLPFFALFAIFFLYPIAYGIWISLTKWNGVKPPVFVGLKNYINIFTNPMVLFWTALGNLGKFIIIVVPVGVIIALGLAILVNQFTPRWASVFRALYFFPIIIPLFLSASIWRFLFVDKGIISSVLAGVGLHIQWLNDPKYEILAVAIVDMWRAIGFHFLLLFTAIKGIPDEYYDAAKVDGANGWQIIRYITIPQLEPVLFLVVVNAFIGGLQSFDLPWLLSLSQAQAYGGVSHGMLFPVMTIYAQAWSALAFGQSAAYAVILGIIVLAITGIQFGFRQWRLSR